MSGAEITRTIEALKANLDGLEEQRRVVEQKIMQHQRAIASLEALDTEEPIEFEGKLADACREVLKASLKPLLPTEIRDSLRGIGYNPEKHSNVLASIHSVLRRMVESEKKEIRRQESADGSVRYEWAVPPPVRAVAKKADIAASMEALADLARSQDAMIRNAMKAAGFVLSSNVLGNYAEQFGGVARYQPIAEEMLKQIQGVDTSVYSSILDEITKFSKP